MELTRADFESLVGTELPFRVGEHATTAKVVEVRVLQSPSPRAEPFALTVHVPASVPYGQGTHVLTHPRLGELEVFMVPLGPMGPVMRYEAIFN